MKVVHTKNKVTLLMRLKEAVDTDTLKIEQRTHRSYVLKRYKWFWIWDVIARIGIYEETIVVRESIWKGYSDVIKRIANVVEDHDKKFHSMTIEVRP